MKSKKSVSRKLSDKVAREAGSSNSSIFSAKSKDSFRSLSKEALAMMTRNNSITSRSLVSDNPTQLNSIFGSFHTIDKSHSWDYSNDLETRTIRTASSFEDSDFALPPLEQGSDMQLESYRKHQKKQKRERAILSKMKHEQKILGNLDALSQTSYQSLARTGVVEHEKTLMRRKNELRTAMELMLLEHVVKRRPGDFKSELEKLQAEDIDLEDGLDHPKLGSLEEKMEDIRIEQYEEHFRKRGKAQNLKHTNKDKRILRKWFQELDQDGSGEVNVEELLDPMLSSGILKTREQVVRVLANVDTNNTQGK